MAIGRKTGGRQRGTPNKRTQRLEAQVEAVQKCVGVSGMTTPLEYMLAVMRNPDLDAALRFEAARASAPYVHARLAAVAVEHSGPDRGPIETRNLTDIEVVRLIGRLLTKTAAAAAAAPATTSD